MGLRFRFRFASEDHERYGDQWWTFNEADLARMRSRELIAIERELRAELGINVYDAVMSLRQAHREATAATLALMWRVLKARPPSSARIFSGPRSYAR